MKICDLNVAEDLTQVEAAEAKGGNPVVAGVAVVAGAITIGRAIGDWSSSDPGLENGLDDVPNFSGEVNIVTDVVRNAGNPR